MLFATALFISFLALLFVYGFIGFGWSGILFDSKTPRVAFAPALGLAIHLIVIMNASYLGFTYDKTSWQQLVFVVIFGLVGYLVQRRGRPTALASHKKEKIWPLLLLAAVVFMAGVSPLIKHGRLGSVSYYSADYFCYWSLGHWLQTYPIGNCAGSTIPINPSNCHGVGHLVRGMRLGAQSWLAWMSTFLGMEVEDLFSILTSIAIALQAVIVALIARALNGRGIWLPCLAGLLYGLHPLIQWSGMAAFFPQNVGLVFALSVFFLFVCENCWRKPLCMGCLSGILMAALWATYVEIVPILAILCGAVVLVAILQKRITWRSLGLFLGGAFFTFVFLAGLYFLLFAKGLWFQIIANTVGADQSPYWWSLFGLLFGFTPVPLDPYVVQKLAWYWKLLITIGVLGTGVLTLWGIGKLPRRWTAWVTAGVFALLMFYAEFRYSDVVKHWSFFKAINYAVPFLLVWVVLAFATLKGWARLLWLLLLVPYAAGEMRFWNHVYAHSRLVVSERDAMTKARENFLQKLPPGCFYVTGLKDDLARYAAFRPIFKRDFITDPDVGNGSGEHVYYEMMNGDTGTDWDTFFGRGLGQVASCRSQRISYVLCGRGFENEFPGEVVYRDSEYSVVKVQGDKTIIFPLRKSYEKDHFSFYLSRSHAKGDERAVLVCSKPQMLKMYIGEQSDSSSIHMKVFEVNAKSTINNLQIPLGKFKRNGIIIEFEAGNPCVVELLPDMTSQSFPEADIDPVTVQRPSLEPPANIELADISPGGIAFTWSPSASPGDKNYALCYGPEAGHYTQSYCTGVGATSGGISNIPPGIWHFAIRAQQDGKQSAFSPDIVYPIGKQF